MAAVRSLNPVRLGLESLESRELPATGTWLIEPFDKPAATTVLPSNWNQWTNESLGPVFSVDQAGAGLGGQGRLVSSAASVTAGRAWVATDYAAGVEASLAVQLNGAAQSQLLVRGSGMNTATPTYYAVGITRGLEVQLLKVVNGKTTVLGTVDSNDYVSNQWVTIKILADGSNLRATVFRGDTNQYLASDGSWTRTPTAALVRTDSSITTGGSVGVARPTGVAGDIPLDNLLVGPSQNAGITLLREERFDGGASVGVPKNWASWTSDGSQAFQVQTDTTLTIRANSSTTARAYLTSPLPADNQVSSTLYVNSLAPVGIFLRGTSVNGQLGTYYELTVTRGLEIDLWKVVNGVRTNLGSLTTKGWQSALWLQVSLVAKGDQLRAEIYRADTEQYLNADGSWGLSPAWAMSRTDASIRNGGVAGVSRGTGAAADALFDSFLVTTAPTDLTKAGVIPTQFDKSTVVTVPPVPPTPPVPPVPPTPPVPPAPVPPVPPTSTTGLPVVPRKFSYIRVAELAYHGTPFGAVEQNLLQTGVDLVIPNLGFVDDINAISPTTPQMVYTNVSNLYLGLLTDWLTYADAHKVDREDAFYHVNKATTFYGNSASAVAVNQFWAVNRGNDSEGYVDVTQDARRAATPTAFGGAGENLSIGYTEKFREINIDLAKAAGTGYAAQLEYVSAVDSQGRPTKWSPLKTISDTTNGLKVDGKVTFDPPSDWVTATINGSARFFYVRYRTTSGTSATAPTANTILANDYSGFNGTSGTIPAFDYAADLNHDGYLSDAEYGKRKAGFDARFEYQSRLNFPYYGQNRFATNVSSPEFLAWTIDYHKRFLASNPAISGFFVDNSTGRLPADYSGLVETVGDYATQFGNILGALNRAIGPNKWLLTNSAGGGTSIEPQIKQGISYLEEFGLRPTASNTVQFEDLTKLIAARRVMSGGKAYEILDTYASGWDVTDPRYQVSSLAMYYLLADPKLSFLMMNGGQEPSSTWSRHWTDAIRYDVGQPVGDQKLFATGADPSNKTLTYKVYERQYQNALVLYKPLSYVKGTTGTTADNTATVHQLDGYYRPLKSDGTLGAPVNKISIRNGEGVILVKV